MSSLARLAALGLLFCSALAAPAAGQAQQASEPASALLKRADELRRAARGLRGLERLELRARAVEVYRSLRRRYPAADSQAALGAFRAGELLRADGDARGARDQFESALALSPDARLRARAGLELGHLARRADLHAQALVRYLAVASETRTPRRERDDARLWAGRSQAALGRHEQARATLEAVARGAADPVDRVTARDECALSWIAVGDLEAAAGELARCRRELRALALEATPTGSRVRSALRRMRSVGRLRAALAERSAGIVIER